MNVTLKPAPELRAAVRRRHGRHAVPAESIESFKIDKLIKYATTFPGGLYNTSFVIMMNPARTTSSRPTRRRPWTPLSGEVAARILGRNWDKADRRAYGAHAGQQRADHQGRRQVHRRREGQDATAGGAVGARTPKAKGMKGAAKVLADFRSEIAKASK
jgi:hypothetical protein